MGFFIFDHVCPCLFQISENSPFCQPQLTHHGCCKEGPALLYKFYHSTIESIVVYCVTVWYGVCSAADKKVIQRVINSINNHWLFSGRDCKHKIPPLETLKSRITDYSHPGHLHFALRETSERHLKTRPNRLKNRFFPKSSGCSESIRTF